MKKIENFTEGPIFLPLIRFALPVLLFHIGLATPASTVVQIIMCGVFFVILRAKQKKSAALD